MKWIAFVLSLWAGLCNAQAQAPSEQSLLWEVTAPGGKAPSYLFGTIHLICPADFHISDSLKTALTKTKQLALEVDIDDPEMMSRMMKTMYMPGDNELKKLISEADYIRLNRFYRDSVGMGLDMFNKAKPFVLMAPLFNAVLSCEPQSYELTLSNMAAKQQTEVIGLETIDEQMAVFDSIPYRDQAKMLLTLIDSLPQARREFDDMVALYRQQKVNDLYQSTLRSEFGMEGNEEVLLFERNRKWIPRIRKIMAEKPTLFAVGAAHLGGEKGVIALLRKEGFKVRPIFN